MHSKNIVHRDLKPENILYATPHEDATLKIADFGLARVVKDKELMKTACGTPGYVAPEVLRNIGYTGSACDMWSTGVILYILLCGFPPFYEEDLPALFDQILLGRYEFSSPWWDNISQQAKDLVNKLLVVDHKKRMTASGLMSDPWIKNEYTERLTDAQVRMRKFNATRKLKKASNAIRLALEKG
eukprot:CAMPEP_0174761330 /NCGR_PEP_ID=MMETSP1094-20130205/109220_1 /TAXON_ID=156173 /ORGANISM="Chrysochromulina brevifilum, Strain UTEX LB 985" /LENGTH=184 /DNA_ID=CAMNT_0015967277 /DNA_START=797 /DNA_END=1351 /DNA_ORIENTATION=-